MTNQEIEITVGDCLAGGGGVTYAIKQIPGVKVSWVLNHNKKCIRTNMFNNRGIKHYWADFTKQNEREMSPVMFLWASIECTQFSKAKGGAEKNIGSYTLGWELIRYIKHSKPLVIGIENVPEFKEWAPIAKNGQPDKQRKGEEFERWKQTICSLGYQYSESINNAADYGIPTRRVRYFAFFTKTELNINVEWAEKTHHKTGANGLKKWEPCREYIDLENEGNSIFGRKYNPDVKKGKRTPLCENSLKRIAGGIKKLYPDLYGNLQMIIQYYGTGTNVQSVEKPLNTITTIIRHALITCEKMQFISDHCHTDNYNTLDEPINPQLTRETKQLITIDKKQFIADYYTRDDTAHSIDGPANTITTENSKHLITVERKFLIQNYKGVHATYLDVPLPTITTVDHNALVNVKAKFISPQYNSNNNPAANVNSLESPLQTISTIFNSSNRPETQNQSIDKPLGTITTGTNKQAVITTDIDTMLHEFDIKMRFLTSEELTSISTFPKGYFTHPLLKISKKDQVKMIGNAVPPQWAKIIIEPVINQLKDILANMQNAVNQ